MCTPYSPLPWVIDHTEGHPYIVSETGLNWDNATVCHLYEDVTPEDSVTIGAWLKPFDNAEANANFILRACNSHDGLIKALEAVLTEHDELLDLINDYHSDVGRPPAIAPIQIVRARAVLEKAKQ